jgi:hypothetical protein
MLIGTARVSTLQEISSKWVIPENIHTTPMEEIGS